MATRTLDPEGVSGGGTARSVFGSPHIRAETILDICVTSTSQNWLGLYGNVGVLWLWFWFGNTLGIKAVQGK